MGDLKPLGSEKLKGDDKLKRILELTYYNTEDKKVPATNASKADYIIETVNGVYGIVKERDGYYVKKGMTESTLDYIGGMFMKNKNKFGSYGEALKRIELIAREDVLTEETKYVLKVKSAAPAPSPSEAPLPEPEVGATSPDGATGEDGGLPPELQALKGDTQGLTDDGTGVDDETSPEDGMGEDDYLKSIQKLTGKLGEKLRDFQDKLESDDIKYVINSVVSALDLEKLNVEDKDDIVSQFEPDEEGTDELAPQTDEIPSDTETPAPDSEMDETMDALERLVNTPLEVDELFQDADPDDKTDDDVDDSPDIEDTEPSDDEFKKEYVFKDDPIDDEEDELPVDYNIDGEFSEQEEAPIEDPLGDEGSDETTDEDPLQSEMGPDDTQTKEIELDALSNLIQQSVKETLSKYFQPQ